MPRRPHHVLALDSATVPTVESRFHGANEDSCDESSLLSESSSFAWCSTMSSGRSDVWMHLLETLITDMANYFLIVGVTCRENEIDNVKIYPYTSHLTLDMHMDFLLWVYPK
jgi:hypothetical protein